MDFGSLKERLIEAAAAAALLGGGSQIVTNSIDLAKHDTRIERLEGVDERLDKMATDLATTRETVIRLETKMEKTP